MPSRQRLRQILTSAAQGIIIMNKCSAFRTGEVKFVKGMVLPNRMASYERYYPKGRAF